MIEAEWLVATDPQPLLMWCQNRVDQRKAWLFSCACLEAVQHLLDPGSRSAIEVLAEFVEGRATNDDFNVAQEEAHAALNECLDDWSAQRQRSVTFHAYRALWVPFDSSPANLSGLSNDCAHALRFAASIYDEPEAFEVENARQLALLRCIFGNPFRPVVFDPGWRSETAVALAAGVYADRAFDRLPILADALEEAGCDHPDILSHCRGPGPHARGCWVVDAVLGKE